MGKEKRQKKEKYMSMKWEIILLILPVVLCITVGALGMIFFTSRNALIEKETMMMEKESATGSAVIGQWTNEILEKVNMVAELIQEDRLGTQKDVSTYLTDHQKLVDGCEDGMYVVYSDGTYIQSGSGIASQPAYLKEKWYQFCQENPEAAFDQCSYYEENGSSGYSVTVGRQLLDGTGKVNGIIAVDAYLDGINEQVAASKDTIDGDIMIIDKKSNMIIASTKEGLSGMTMGESTDSFIQAIAADVEGSAIKDTYTASGNTYYTAGSVIQGTDWIYVVYVDGNVALSSLHTVRNIAVTSVVVLIILITMVCIIVIGHQMKKLRNVESRIAETTEGKFYLNGKSGNHKWKNEIVSIHEDLDRFIGKMIQMIKMIIMASKNLSHHAQVFSQMAEDLEADAVTESQAVNDLTSTIGEMTGAVQSLAENATELAGIVENTQSSGIEAGQKMKEVVEIVDQSNMDITNVSSEMKKVEVSMLDLEKLVVEVSDAAEKINSITGVIKSIAEETNLLSLNATIEAARAGEQGRGFAVVADQIKSLAATSEENAGAIENLILNISSLIEKTSDATKSNVTGMQVSFEKLEETTASFHQITTVVKDTNEMLDALVKDIAHVDQIATDIAAISEEQAASSEEILATTQTVNENVERTKEKSEKIKEGTAVLSVAADDLENEMKFFQI